MRDAVPHLAALAQLLQSDETTADLPLRELQALGIVVAYGPLPVRDVANRTGLSGSHASRIVERLVTKGLVARVRDVATDRRLTSVGATHAGCSVDQRVREHWASTAAA